MRSRPGRRRSPSPATPGRCRPLRARPGREGARGGLRTPASSRPGAGQPPAVPRSVRLSQVHLVELLDPGGRPPSTHQRCRAPRLARVRESRLDLLGEHVSHVDLQRGLDAGEAPGFRRLVRRTGLWKREWVARAGPGGVECDATDHAVIRMKAIGNVRVEREEDIRFRGADLAHKLFAQVEVLDQLRIGVAKKLDALDAQNVRGHLLLALANARYFGAGPGGVARAFVA